MADMLKAMRNLCQSLTTLPPGFPGKADFERLAETYLQDAVIGAEAHRDSESLGEEILARMQEKNGEDA